MAAEQDKPRRVQAARDGAAPGPQVACDPLPYRTVGGMAHRLRRQGQVLHLELGPGGVLIASAFLLSAAVLAGTLAWFQAPTQALVMIPGFFAGLGAFSLLIALLRRANEPRARFDLEARRAVLPAQPGGKPREVPLDEVAAVQLCQGYLHRNQPGPNQTTSEGVSHELVLVLAGGKRLLLLPAMGADRLQGLGQELAEALGVPLLDHRQDAGEAPDWPYGSGGQ